MSNVPGNNVLSFEHINHIRRSSTYDCDILLRHQRDRALEMYRNLCLQRSLKQPLLPLPTIDWSAIGDADTVRTQRKHPAGVHQYDLKTFCALYPDYATDILSSQLYDDPMHALIDGIYLDASVIYVEPGIQCTLSIDDSGNTAHIEKFILVADEYAVVTMQQKDLTRDVSLSMKAITFFLLQNSRVRLRYHNAMSMHALYMSIYLKANSVFEGYCWINNAQYAHYGIQLYLLDHNAQADMYIGYKATGNEQINIITKQHHQASDAQSTIKLRGILYDTAYSAYEGIIRVDTGASNTLARMEHKNIICGHNVRAWSVPSLEVLTDQVHCSHGSAMGPLDKNQLLYLTSRGIDVYHAEQLLIDGFFNEIGIEEKQITS